MNAPHPHRTLASLANPPLPRELPHSPKRAANTNGSPMKHGERIATREMDSPEAPPISFTSAASLRGVKIELPPPLIEGILRRREVMVFAGESKIGKTWLALKLAHSVAAGVPWFNQSTHANPVLYLNFEIDGAACNLRTQMICQNAGAWPDGLHLAHLRGTRADIAGMAPDIVKAAKERRAALIIIDALYNALGDRDENSNADMAELIHECTALAVEADAAVCLVHHFNKGSHGAGGDDEAPAANRMAGAGALMRAPDSIVTVTRVKAEHLDRYGLSSDELNLMVSASLRTQTDLAPFIIARAHGSHLARRLAVNVREANTNAVSAKRGGAKAKYTTNTLPDILRESGPLTLAEFREKSASSGGPKGGTFDRLKDEGFDSGKIFFQDGKIHAASPQPEPRGEQR